MKFKLLVFDWDGTLMDSLARITDCMRSAARDTGVPVPGDEMIRDVIGLGLGEAIQTLFPNLDEALWPRIGDRYRHYFLNVNRDPSPLFSGVLEVLERLSAEGYLLAVATGKSRRGLESSLDSSGLRRLFHATRCADEASSKPHPEMLLQLMEVLGSEPSETVMIGDTEYDMEMAANAQAHGIGVSYGVHPCDRLGRHGVLGCIDRFEALPELLSRSQGIGLARAS